MTPTSATRPFGLTTNTELGRALARATDRFSQKDVTGTDEGYQAVVRLARDDTGLRAALAFDHVVRLWELDDDTLALQRCTDYLSEPVPDDVDLRLLRAEILSSMGRHAGAHEDATTIRAALGENLTSLTADQRARLYRVEAFRAADEGDVETALKLLALAREEYRSVPDKAGMARIDGDRRAIGVSQGWDADVAATLSEAPPDTVAGRLKLAMAHAARLHYDDALTIVRGILADPGLDPGPRGTVLYEYFRLLRLTRQHDQAERLFPQLREATAADPALADQVARLSMKDSSAPVGSARPDHQLEYARRLLAEQRLADVEKLLDGVRPRVRSARDVATWHLVSGQLALARPTGEQRNLPVAVDHLDTAIDHTGTTPLTEVRVLALSARGEAAFRLDDYERAIACWTEAYALEERTASYQHSDEVRVGMLMSASTVLDSLVTATVSIKDRQGPEAAAAVVVAMEMTRGATLLDHLTGHPGTRDLPGPLDLAACRLWLSQVTDTFSPAQAIWITHTTPDRVHHAVISRDGVHHRSFPLQKRRLTDAVDRHRSCWSSPQVLETSIHNGVFDDSLADIGALIRVHDVLSELPRQVRRLAVVPAPELGDVPFAAMPVPDSPDRLVHRFALSDLPSLSVLRPLHQRSLRLRGNRTLRVRPGLDAHRRRGRLDGTDATAAHLSSALASRRYRLLRVDAHGRHHDTGTADMSWLQLAPPDATGRLTPPELANTNLNGCGTVLLGACESGMGRYRGRVERTGFPRAAMLAGATAVVAARWIAREESAAEILDRFERYARHLPRDLALQRAQVDLCESARGAPTDLLFHRHPARWACWTLFGDPGHQTRAVYRPLHRILLLLHRILPQRRTS